MIKLYDTYGELSQDLDYSLSYAGFDGQTVVINETGFLPDGVISPYGYFCQMTEQEGKPLYFNELAVPNYWEITGNNAQGDIYNLGQKMATIYYSHPSHLRFIRNVDWLSSLDKVSYTDHYNQYGWRYAQTTFSEKEEIVLKTYYNKKQEEIITENFKTGDIILNWKGSMHFFKGRVAFVLFFLTEAGLDTTNVWFNSLSVPFFVSRSLDQNGQDILFWQEPIGDDIPGNMRAIFNNPDGRTKQIVVQDKSVYDKIMSLLTQEEQQIVSYLPCLYPQKSYPSKSKNILLITNSDQIHGLQVLVEGLPKYTFHIAALTEMSQRLTQFGKYANVYLYPNISMNTVDDLFASCDIYLDINYGSEVVSALRKAYEHQQLILAFKNTSHNPKFIENDLLFEADDIDGMVTFLQQLTKPKWKQKIARRVQSLDEIAVSYQELLGGQ